MWNLVVQYLWYFDFLTASSTVVCAPAASSSRSTPSSSRYIFAIQYICDRFPSSLRIYCCYTLGATSLSIKIWHDCGHERQNRLMEKRGTVPRSSNAIISPLSFKTLIKMVRGGRPIRTRAASCSPASFSKRSISPSARGWIISAPPASGWSRGGLA